MLRATVLLLLIPSLFLPASLSAQGDAANPFIEVIDVRVVNLEVVVVDRQGNRVSGLGPEDFRLVVDKGEARVEYFSEVFEGVTLDPGPDGELLGIPGLDAGQPVGTSYLVFIDEYFTTAHDRNRVLRGILEEVGRLGHEDRMALVAFNGRNLQMLSSWSQSPQALERVFEQAMGRSAQGLLTRAALAENVSLDNSFDAEFRHDELMERLERVTMATTATLRSFAQPPGRKVMLLVTGGWPYLPAAFNVERARDRKILWPIYETANLLGYTLYPIDAAGAEPVFPAADRPNPGPLGNINYDELDDHTTLHLLADKTGGRALIDGARLTSLERVIQDTRSYYWLGFTPKWKGNDRDHKIRLEVLRPGLKVRTRQGFKDLSRSQEVSFQVESALMFGELPGAHPLNVAFGTPTKRRGRLVVPVALAIPMDAVTMLPVRQGHYEARLELRIAALDAGGHRNEIAALPVVLSGDRLPQPGEQSLYETAVKMRNQSHDLVVSLHDPVSGAIFARVERLVY